ncbi:hypothetical protein MBLNU13_g01499t1 [Cladosporium sp. NU13]
MAPDANLPSAKRAACIEWMVEQPAELQKLIIENLSFREQVHLAAKIAEQYKDWTTLLLVNDIHADRIYTKVPGSNPNIAISDVIFSQPEFRTELTHGNLNGRTAKELKDFATHTRDCNMGVDRPSAAAKQALGLPQHNSETWIVLLQRDQNENNRTRSMEFGELRRDEDRSHYLESSRPRYLLDVFSDLVGLRRDFTAAPNGIFCSSCLLGKFLTPQPLYIYPGAGRICVDCVDCLGPELERQFIPLTEFRRFMAENEFYTIGRIIGYGLGQLRYTNLTATGRRTQIYTQILRKHASVMTQERFGLNFDDVMYLLDNGKILEKDSNKPQGSASSLGDRM